MRSPFQYSRQLSGNTSQIAERIIVAVAMRKLLSADGGRTSSCSPLRPSFLAKFNSRDGEGPDGFGGATHPQMVRNWRSPPACCQL